MKVKYPIYIVVIWTLAAIASPLLATTYYIDINTGSDSNGGTTPSSAWKSLTKASSVTFQPGDRILFKRGCTWSGSGNETVTWHGSGTAISPIEVNCYDSSGVIGAGGSGALPILTGNTSSEHTFLIQGISYWSVSNLEVRGGVRGSVSIWNSNTSAGTKVSGITLQSLKIRSTHWRPHGDGTGRAPGAGIYCYNDGANSRTFEDLVIDNCDIQNVAQAGIRIQSSQIKANTTNVSAYNTRVKVTNNTVAYTYSSGIIVTGCKDFLIEENTVDHAGSYLQDGQTNFVGIFPGSCYGGIIQYNLVSNTAQAIDGQAFDLDEGNAGAFYFQHNISYRNHGGFFQTTNNSLNGLIPGVIDRCIVRFNVSYNDAFASDLDNGYSVSMWRLTGSTHEFYNNTFYCASSPFITYMWAPGTGTVHTRWAGAPNTTRLTFKNNIIFCPDGMEGYVGNPSYVHANYDLNCFFSSNGGRGSNQINADPQFINPGDPIAGLKLASTSPCVNAGIREPWTPPSAVDAYGFLYDLGTTIGADQLENVVRLEFEQDASDSSGHGNNGSPSGGGITYLASGMQQGTGCASFNGSSYLSLPSSTSTDLEGNELCIDMWVKATSAPGGYRRLVDKMTVGGVDGFFIDLTPTNQVRFNVRGYQLITTGTVPTTGEWTHIVGAWQSGGSMSVYLNGIADTTRLSGNSALWASTNTWPLLIGADQNGGSRFKGQLDDVQIRRSSDSRITDAVLSYEFEGNLADSSSCGNTGALGGSGTTFTPSQPISGSYAIDLNGSGYITIKESKSLGQLADGLCIDMWIKTTSAPSGYRRLVDKMTVGGVDGFFIDLTPANQVRFNVRGYQLITVGTVPTTGEWTHIVGTWQPGGSMSVYLNGVADTTRSSGNSAPWASTNTWPLLIGADQNGGSRFKGQLDDVQIRRTNPYDD